MNARRGFGLLWALLTLLIAVAVGAAAYQWGLSTSFAGTAPAAAAGAAPYYGPWAYGFGFGFGLFHLLGILFFVFLLVALIRFAFGGRRWGGYGHWGGPGEPGGPRGAYFQERFEEMHRRAHGEPAGPAAPADGGPK